MKNENIKPEGQLPAQEKMTVSEENKNRLLEKLSKWDKEIDEASQKFAEVPPCSMLEELYQKKFFGNLVKIAPIREFGKQQHTQTETTGDPNADAVKSRAVEVFNKFVDLYNKNGAGEPHPDEMLKFLRKNDPEYGAKSLETRTQLYKENQRVNEAAHNTYSDSVKREAATNTVLVGEKLVKLNEEIAERYNAFIKNKYGHLFVDAA